MTRTNHGWAWGADSRYGWGTAGVYPDRSYGVRWTFGRLLSSDDGLQLFDQVVDFDRGSDFHPNQVY